LVCEESVSVVTVGTSADAVHPNDNTEPVLSLAVEEPQVRKLGGNTHTVLAREDGFEYDGQRYRSLTVIAERITGAHWSGPRYRREPVTRARNTSPQKSRLEVRTRLSPGGRWIRTLGPPSEGQTLFETPLSQQ
jgi:hypothetical protein